MAIGTAAAIIGGAALSAGGSMLAASSAKKAANKAADTSLAVAKENNALSEKIYNQNTALLSPYNQRGNTAGDYINAFLGIPGTSTTTTTPGVTTTKPASGGTSDLFSADKTAPFRAKYGDNWYIPYVQSGYGGNQPSGGTASTTTTTPATTVTKPNVTQADAQNAFSSYLKNSDFGYQSALGGQQVSGNYSGLGTLQSGAALKALQDRQNNINQGYQTNWLGQLANQQGVGLSGASAVAGVGQNYVNSVTANNNSAGSAAANAALVGGQNNGLANALGSIGGSFLSYGLK